MRITKQQQQQQRLDRNRLCSSLSPTHSWLASKRHLQRKRATLIWPPWMKIPWLISRKYWMPSRRIRIYWCPPTLLLFRNNLRLRPYPHPRMMTMTKKTHWRRGWSDKWLKCLADPCFYIPTHVVRDGILYLLVTTVLIYFTTTTDITNSFQRSLVKGEEDSEYNDPQVPLWKKVDKRFWWNEHLTRDFVTQKVTFSKEGGGRDHIKFEREYHMLILKMVAWWVGGTCDARHIANWTMPNWWLWLWFRIDIEKKSRKSWYAVSTTRHQRGWTSGQFCGNRAGCYFQGKTGVMEDCAPEAKNQM